MSIPEKIVVNEKWWVPEEVWLGDQLHIEELERLVIAADRAVGTHNAPDDCYATGPLTGDPIADLVECPACTYLTMREKVTVTQPKG